MISEAASSGKNTIVFTPQIRPRYAKRYNKHRKFVEGLNKRGYVLSVDVDNLGQTITNVAKAKMRTKKLDDQAIILEKARFVI